VVLNDVLVHLFVLVRSWAEVVAFTSPMMRGVQFSFSLIMVVICACISKREACASGALREGQ
jgi:formate/nitrite transporter FocA (FNT family)